LSLPVLYSGDYGYHAGPKIYRGRLKTLNATGVNVTAQNGVAAGWSAWLNGQYVGGSPGNSSLATTSDVLKFNTSSLKATLRDRNDDNVLTILTDYTGHDEDNVKPEGAQNPRGILGAVLQGEGSFTSWKIQGNAGGEKNIDPTRGPMNEGGLYAERMGWHLPGFQPDDSWDTSAPYDGVPGASGRFYITNFTLDIDDGLDVPLGLKVNASASVPAVVYIWLNGYQFGHYLPHIGPQSVFSFQPGIMNTQKNRPNTLAVSLWALADREAKLEQVELVAYGKYTSGFDFAQDWSYLQPGWKDRSEYA
jgi:beta-galactosidase